MILLISILNTVDRNIFTRKGLIKLTPHPPLVQVIVDIRRHIFFSCSNANYGLVCQKLVLKK